MKSTPLLPQQLYDDGSVEAETSPSSAKAAAAAMSRLEDDARVRMILCVVKVVVINAGRWPMKRECTAVLN